MMESAQSSSSVEKTSTTLPPSTTTAFSYKEDDANFLSENMAMDVDTSANDIGDTSNDNDTPVNVDTSSFTDTHDSDNMSSNADMPTDEAGVLEGLAVDIQDHADVERDITRQANQAINQKEDEKDQKRIDKVNVKLSKLQREREDITGQRAVNPFQAKQNKDKLEKLDEEIQALEEDLQALQSRIDDRHQDDGNYEAALDSQGGGQKLPSESQRDFLIRTGKITPFSAMPKNRDGIQGGLAELLIDAEDNAALEPYINDAAGPTSHVNLKLPGFNSGSNTVDEEFNLRPRKKQRTDDSSNTINSRLGLRSTTNDSAEDFTPVDDESDEEFGGMAGFVAADGAIKKKGTKRKPNPKADENIDFSSLDDGNEENYQARLKDWVERRSEARRNFNAQSNSESESFAIDSENEEEWNKPCPDPSTPDHKYDNGVTIPGDIYHSLFDYQRVGVQWLGELYSQDVGGILGDEMGLGKTIQVVSFIAGLHFSHQLDGPVIVVAPATVLSQWVKEFHRWWPPLRVSILHSSGSGMMSMEKEEQDLERKRKCLERRGHATKQSSLPAKRVANTVVKKGHVLVTTYSGLQTFKDILTKITWSYAVLDEGHKIRNPEAAITLAAKELRTAKRALLTGTPMQNNLVELWSLFDFVCPMRLGNLVEFRQQFNDPINFANRANATNMELVVAETSSRVLKNVISPFFMQRLKSDVATDLPKKTEKVVFCHLTKYQRSTYEDLLRSEEMESTEEGKRNILGVIGQCSKICNHPDLLQPLLYHKLGYPWGSPEKSAKMLVVKGLLNLWSGKDNKVLLFTQGMQILNMLEAMIKNLGYKYFRMDGKTRTDKRQQMVDRFNTDPEIYIFLLTTKVGGLGVNLTGANRVIIFDPNWNPSTDMQARERAWRLGQKREVTIFRLMTAGTIEEKIYHRQIFKQFLSDKVLKDPTKLSKFNTSDLGDLFILTDLRNEKATETGHLFHGTETKLSSRHASGRNSDSAAAAEDFSGVEGILSAEDYDDPDPDVPKDKEERLLNGIFARSGVYSLLSHDEVINGKKKVTADRGMIEATANKIAKEGEDLLKRSGEIAKVVRAGQVTWTGNYGEQILPSTYIPTSGRRPTGAPDSSPTSSPFRSNIKQEPEPQPIDMYPVFRNQIINYVQRVNVDGMGVATAAIHTHFNTQVGSAPERKVAFINAFEDVLVKKNGPQGSSDRAMITKWEIKPGLVASGSSRGASVAGRGSRPSGSPWGSRPSGSVRGASASGGTVRSGTIRGGGRTSGPARGGSASRTGSARPSTERFAEAARPSSSGSTSGVYQGTARGRYQGMVGDGRSSRQGSARR